MPHPEAKPLELKPPRLLLRLPLVVARRVHRRAAVGPVAEGLRPRPRHLRGEPPQPRLSPVPSRERLLLSPLLLLLLVALLALMPKHQLLGPLVPLPEQAVALLGNADFLRVLLVLHSFPLLPVLLPLAGPGRSWLPLLGGPLPRLPLPLLGRLLHRLVPLVASAALLELRGSLVVLADPVAAPSARLLLLAVHPRVVLLLSPQLPARAAGRAGVAVLALLPLALLLPVPVPGVPLANG